MKNKKAIKKFWKKIRFKYKLILINDTTFKKVFSCELSQLSAFIITLFISLLFIFLVVVVIIGTPLKSYLPGYMDSYLRSEIINVQMRLDSLSEINDIRMRYLDNVKNILSGDIKPDSVAPLDSMVIKVTSDSLYNKSELEMAFVDNFEQEEKYNLSVIINNTTGKTFFTPVRGVLSQKYNKQDKNYGVSVLCAGNAHISTPLDGVVFFCGYTLDYSYVVHIQHNNDYISVFKNLGNIFVKTGQHLNTGSVIGTPGTYDSIDKKPLLYYELWHKGSPVNPEDYMNF